MSNLRINPATTLCSGVSGVLMMAMSMVAAAGDVVLPHTFAAGTPAKAAEVNANFDALVDAVNALNQRLSGAACTTIDGDMDFKLVVSGVDVGGGDNFMHVANDSIQADVCIRQNGTLVLQDTNASYTEVNGPQASISNMIDHVEGETGNDPNGELERLNATYVLNADCSLDVDLDTNGSSDITLHMNSSLTMGVGTDIEKEELCNGGSDCTSGSAQDVGDNYYKGIIVLVRKGTESSGFCASL